MKDTEQNFPVVLFITGMLLKVVPTFESEDEILSWTIHFLVHIAVLAFEWEDEMKALEQLCPMVLVTIQYKLVLSFDYSNESFNWTS